MAIFDSIGGFIKGVGRALTGGLSVVLGGLGMLGGWIIGIPGFLIDVIIFPISGWRPEKDMRIRYIVLAEENGRPLLQPEQITATTERTAEIFLDRANIRIRGQNVLTVFGAPAAALDVPGPAASFLDQFSEAGEYFNSLAGIGAFTTTITVFVVKSMQEHDGRSFGQFTNFVLVEAGVFTGPDAPQTTVAHELGHQCGLLHRGTLGNLMYDSNKDDQGNFRGTALSTWQEAVIRASRFVWL